MAWNHQQWYNKISTINDTYTIKNIPITNKRILSLSIKQNGNLLCGTENDGLFEIHKKNNKIINHKFDKNIQDGIKSNSIWSTYTDDKNRVWLGYYNNGIDVYNENYNKFKSLRSISTLQIQCNLLSHFKAFISSNFR